MVDGNRFLTGFKVQAIVVLPGRRGVELTLCAAGHDPIQLRTRRFGVGHRDAKSAALAKFASSAGYGPVEDVFDYVAALPRDFVGNIFPTGPLGVQDDAVPPLANV